MSSISRTAVVLGCATALTLLPALVSGPGFVADGFGQQAYAKGGNGNGGNGNGGGHGNGNGSGGGKSADAGKGQDGGKGASASAGGKSNGAGKGVAGFFEGVFGGGRGKGKNDAATSEGAKAASAAGAGKKSNGKQSLAAQQNAALKGKAVPVPAKRDEVLAKNTTARLAGLNSMKRSYNAYLNAKDPKFAAIQAFVLNSVAFETAVADLAEAAAALAAAEEEFAALLGTIVPHETVASEEETPEEETVEEDTAEEETFSYAGRTVAELETRLGELEGIDPTTLSVEQAAALDAEITALSGVLGSAELTALNEAAEQAAEAEATAAELEAATSTEALKEAMLAGANANRIAEYGDDYVNDEMLGWASDLLGVGDAYGKIDQVREALEAEAAPTDEDTTETAGIEPTDTEETVTPELIEAE